MPNWQESRKFESGSSFLTTVGGVVEEQPGTSPVFCRLLESSLFSSSSASLFTLTGGNPMSCGLVAVNGMGSSGSGSKLNGGNLFSKLKSGV